MFDITIHYTDSALDRLYTNIETIEQLVDDWDTISGEQILKHHYRLNYDLYLHTKDSCYVVAGVNIISIEIKTIV